MNLVQILVCNAVQKLLQFANILLIRKQLDHHIVHLRRVHRPPPALRMLRSVLVNPDLTVDIRRHHKRSPLLHHKNIVRQHLFAPAPLFLLSRIPVIIPLLAAAIRHLPHAVDVPPLINLRDKVPQRPEPHAEQILISRRVVASLQYPLPLELQHMLPAEDVPHIVPHRVPPQIRDALRVRHRDRNKHHHKRRKQHVKHRVHRAKIHQKFHLHHIDEIFHKPAIVIHIKHIQHRLLRTVGVWGLGSGVCYLVFLNYQSI